MSNQEEAEHLPLPDGSCITEELMGQIASGILSDTYKAAINTHLRDCDDCRRKIGALGASKSLTDTNEAQSQVDSVPDHSPSRRHAPADGDALSSDDLLPPPETHSLFADVLPWLTPSVDEHGPGQLGEFVIRRLLGRGGMGVVFLATDTRLHRDVAIKVLAPVLMSDSAARDRFLREARSAAKVRHPGIVGIHQVRDEGSLPYIVIEYIDGPSLEEELTDQGKLTPDRTREIGLNVADALAAAHEQGLIHRDIKPGNVLLETKSGQPKLTDFGLARGTTDVTITVPGALVGTPAYMAPEVVAEEKPDATTDVFSLGAMLYHMITGKPPFVGGTVMATLHRVTTGRFQSLLEAAPDCPPDLAATIERALSHNRQDRPQSAAEMCQLLANDQDPGVTSNRRTEQPPEFSRRIRMLVCLGVAAILPFGISQWLAGRNNPGAHDNAMPAASDLPAPQDSPTSDRRNPRPSGATPPASSALPFPTLACFDEQGRRLSETAPSLEAAIELVPSGGRIEISGPVPLSMTDVIFVRDKHIELRGMGRDPVELIAEVPERVPVINVSGKLKIRHLFFRNEGIVVNGELVVEACTFASTGGPCISMAPDAVCHCHESIFYNPHGPGISWPDALSAGELVMTECTVSADSGILLDNSFRGRIQVADSDFCTAQVFDFQLDDADAARGVVSVRDSILLASEATILLRSITRFARPRFAEQFAVSASGNTYSEPIIRGENASLDGDESLIESMAHWQRVAAISDPGSHVVDPHELAAEIDQDVEALIAEGPQAIGTVEKLIRLAHERD